MVNEDTLIIDDFCKRTEPEWKSIFIAQNANKKSFCYLAASTQSEFAMRWACPF